MAVHTLALRPSFPVRLRLAAMQPLVLRLSLISITAASIGTYINTTLRLSPGFMVMVDFSAYYHAAKDLAAGIDPYLYYNHSGPFSLAGGYVYPPFFARVLQPLTLLAYSQATLLNLVILQIAVLSSIYLTWKLLNLRSWIARLFILDAFLLSYNLVSNLQLGQVNVLLMALTLAWILAYTRRSPLAWALVGFNVGLKLQQAPLFALALFRRDWRGLTLGLLTLLATFAIGGLALAFEFFTHVLPRLSSTVPQSTSLLADIERVLHPNAADLPYDPTYMEARFLLAGIIVLVLFFTARAIHSLQDRYLEALIALSATPLLSNYLSGGHLLPLFPVGILLTAYAYRLGAYRLFALLALSTFFIADSAVFYPFLNVHGFLYQVLPGLAVLALWLSGLRLAKIVKSA